MAIRRKRRYPMSLREERGELTLPEDAPLPPRGAVRSDVGVHSAPDDALRGSTGMRLPGVNSQVASFYDTRPINARDFFTSAINSSVVGAQTFTISVQVPIGYVMSVREFSYQIGTLSVANVFTPESGTATGQIQFFVDGIESPFHLPAAPGLSFPPSVFIADNGMSRQPVFVLALPGALVSMKVTYTGSVSNALYAQMYGQLLLYRGLPLPFEIGSNSAMGQ